MNLVTYNPKLVTFAIGFAVTFVIGTIIGVLEQGHLSWDAFVLFGKVKDSTKSDPTV